MESTVSLAVALARTASNPSFRYLLDSANRQAGLVTIESEARRITYEAASSAAPPSQRLSWERYMEIRRARDQCEHTSRMFWHVSKHQAGENGHFTDCQECQRRWKWSEAGEKWEIYDKDAVEAGFICKETMKLLRWRRHLRQQAEQETTAAELARRESEMRTEFQEQAIAQTVPDAAGWELTPDRRGSFQRRPSRSSDGSQASQ